MGDSWIIDNLVNALNTWNSKFQEIWALLTTSPQNFKGGTIWTVIKNIHGTLQAIALALLVIFFVCGVVKTCGSFTEVKKLEHVLKLFVRFAIAKGVVTYGLDLLLAIMEIAQGTITSVMNTTGVASYSKIVLPEVIKNACNDVGWLEAMPLYAVTLIGSLFITILSFIMILTVYGRFFKIYLYTAISPLPLSTFAGQPFQSMGINFLKSFSGVCLEGLIIVISCVIFSAFVVSPTVNADASASSMLWGYISEIIFNLLVLVGTVKMSDRIIKELMGL